MNELSQQWAVSWLTQAPHWVAQVEERCQTEPDWRLYVKWAPYLALSPEECIPRVLELLVVIEASTCWLLDACSTAFVDHPVLRNGNLYLMLARLCGHPQMTPGKIEQAIAEYPAFFDVHQFQRADFTSYHARLDAEHLVTQFFIEKFISPSTP